MKEFVEFIIKNLVDKPGEVQVKEITGERTTVLELRVDKGDTGKVIGRSGQTVRSLRTLITAAATKQGKRYVLEILEDETKKAIMNIYIGNLSGDVGDDDLRQAFEAFGQVASVTVIKDKFSGESRGFGFVEMTSKDEAQSAIEALNGKDLKWEGLKRAKPYCQ